MCSTPDVDIPPPPAPPPPPTAVATTVKRPAVRRRLRGGGPRGLSALTIQRMPSVNIGTTGTGAKV